jgi:erythromycin esterase
MTLIEPRRRPSDELDELVTLATPLADPGDLDPLMERIGDVPFVLLGEASHGTSEYYRWRADLSKRLITERGFSFVALEGDWPDCFAVNQWVKGRAGQERSAAELLGGFGRWPTWMWANEEVAEFATWLRDHNLRIGGQVGFYGLDVYSLWESLRRIFGYLHDRDPGALAAAADALRCFEPYGEDPQRYAWATRMVPTNCEQEVLDLLIDVHMTRLVDDDDPEAELDAVQNAEVLAGAERYYRTMVQADASSWNVRDLHMVDTLDRLIAYHGSHGKALVWEHNTHVGDARATDMAAAGMINVGQVVRERHHDLGVVLVRFAGHHGSVIAAESWGAAMQPMAVPKAPAATHEDLLHQVQPQPALLVFPDRRDTPWLSARHGHRAIGVVYHPELDRRGNWVPTTMGERYDALLSFDETSALHPLQRTGTDRGEFATYSSSA